ncbi:MAG: hypothetical protein WCK00_16470 [Deltaproteobacteria bacterium]
MNFREKEIQFEDHTFREYCRQIEEQDIAETAEMIDIVSEEREEV